MSYVYADNPDVPQYRNPLRPMGGIYPDRAVLDAQAKIVEAFAKGREAARLERRDRSRPLPGREEIALAWHDVTCPEAEECRDRRAHSRRLSLVTSGVVERFLGRLEAEGLL